MISKIKKYDIQLILSLFFFALYMLFFYKINLYSPSRALSYNLAYTALLLLNILICFLSGLKKSAGYNRHVYSASLFFMAAVILLSIDWLAGINLLASNHRFKIFILFIQLFQIVPYVALRFSGSGLKKIKELNKSAPENRRVLFPAIYMAGIVLLVTPLRLYSTAPGEIETGFMKLFLSFLSSFSVAAIFMVALYFIFPRFLKKYLYLIYTYIALLVFAYTFIVPGNFGALDKFMLTDSANLYGGFYRNLLEAVFLVLFWHLASFLTASAKGKYLPAVFIVLFGVALLELIPALSRSMAAAPSAGSGETSQAVSLLPEYNSDLMGYSGTGKNIVVIMLDMFTGGYVPQIMEDLPDIKENFNGFIWYPNTLSIGYNTSTSVPALYGGWAYSPVNINKSGSGKSLLWHIEESYELLPKLLAEKGYAAAYTDPDYYKTPFGDLEALSRQGITGGYNKDYVPYWKYKNRDSIATGSPDEKDIAPLLLSMVSVFKASPFLLKPVLYDSGDWLLVGKDDQKNRAYNFALDSWAFLDLMKDISNVDAGNNTFKYFHNFVTHAPYAMSMEGVLIKDEFPDPEAGNNVHGKNAYYSARASLQAVSGWIDWLKLNNIYDNTMIILVSDHGNELAENPMMPDGFFVEGLTNENFTRIHALLMVKDFGSTAQFSEDWRFLSNADVPSIICSAAGINVTEIGPGPTTGNPPAERILDTVKSDSWRWETLSSGKVYNFEWHYRVKNSIFDAANWEKIK